MAGMLSRFALMIQECKFDEVKALIDRYPTIVSGSASVSGRKSKVLGTVLHVSKGKKLTYNSKTTIDKKIKKETAYYRMVFCRLVLQSRKRVFCLHFYHFYN